MTTLSSSSCVVHNDPWVHRGFRKDKLRVRERYWRWQEELSFAENNVVVIPSGVVWRTYLPLLMHLIEKTSRTNWILLESAADLMDWRNSSPSIKYEGSFVCEAAATQERSRIKKLFAEKKVIPFCDLSARQQEHDEWNDLRYSEMTIAERSQHALLRAGRIVLSSSNNRVVLILDESEYGFAQDREEADEIQRLNMSEFITFLVDQTLILDTEKERLEEMKTRCQEEYKRRNFAEDGGSTTGTTPHFSDALVHEGIHNGTLLRGRLEVTKENPREAYVTDGDGQKWFINQVLGHYNRSLHHDVVVVQPLPQASWARPVGRRRLLHHDASDDTMDALDSEEPPVPSARVVAIHAPSRRRFVATLVDQPAADEIAFLVIPMSVQIPKIRLRSRGWEKYVNKRLLVEVDDWDEGSNYPSGHCVRILGDVGDLETEITCLLMEHGIQLEPFSVNAMSCLPPEGADWTIPKEEVEVRRDLRKTHRIFSVDPPGCQDIDDTMHARTLPNGDVEVGVHIADVSHFVAHKSALDLEAQVRGTTFYLVDRRFDMLPSLLSCNLCSLHGNTDRLAVSVIWTLSSDLETVKSCWYGRTIIHNMQAMTYEQAHNILHDKPPDDATKAPPPPLMAGAPVDPAKIGALKQDLSILTRLSRKLRKDREDFGGAVDLSSGDLGSELKFVLDENGYPIKVASNRELEIHHTIAEMMILANQYVAKKIFKHFPESSLLRIHQTVQEHRFNDLEKALKAGGVAFDGSSNMALAKSLNVAKQQAKGGNKQVNALLQSLATRAMSEAKYICTGGQVGTSLTHYGLGIEHYTHFTSPIRRYADVVVHKQLLEALQDRPVVAMPSVQDARQSKQTFLDEIPDSNVMSVLGGEGLRNARGSETTPENELEGEDLLDSLIEGASTLAIGAETSDVGKPSEKDHPELLVADEKAPYTSLEVSKICDGLNSQNRMAKLSSFECQRLFLSLYFRDNVVQTQAVVTDLRVNGLLVYVPMFDLKGPVFLIDINGNVQIDPALLGLPPDAGFPATLGFTAVKRCRMLPTGSCVLKESGGENKKDSLVVTIPDYGDGHSCAFRALDVVTVQLSCDLSDTKARVPPPRLHLVSVGYDRQRSSGASRRSPLKSEMIQNLQGVDRQKENTAPKHSPLQTGKTPAEGSIAEVLASIDVRPRLPGVPLRCEHPPNKSKGEISTSFRRLGGRIVVGNFTNMDTRTASQEAAVAAAAESAAQRRAAAASRSTKEDDYRSTERMATSRMQRLAAQKRNARVSKSK